MSYVEELLIKIRSAYDSGGFSSLSADLSKAKSGYNQVAKSASGTTGPLNKVGQVGRSSFMELNYGAKGGSSAIDKISTSASGATNRLGQVGTAGAKAGSNVAKGGEVGSKGLNSISTAGNGAISTMDGLSIAIGGVIGGFGLMEMATSSWTGSTTKQFNSAYLQTKMSSAAASDYISQIQQIVAEVPGDDTFMNNLMTGAVAKQTNLTATELKTLGIVSADYLTTSQAMGKSALETQMDLKEYILTGNTSQLERDSILKQQMGTLEGQGTVSERILALNKALKDEGYAGLSQLDIASIKAEELKGKFQLAATTLGEKILPYVEQFVEFMLDLDESTGGVSTEIIFLAGGAIAAAGALGLIAGPIKSAITSAKDLVGWIKDKIPSVKTTTVKCVKDPSCKGTDGTTTTTTKTALQNLKSDLTAIFAGTSGAAAASGTAVAVTFIFAIIATLAEYGIGYYVQSWLNSQQDQMSGPAEKFGIDFGMALMGGLLPGIQNAVRDGSAAAGNSFLQWFDQFDWAKAAEDKINADLGNLKIQIGGILDWGNWVKAPGQIMDIINWLNKVICAIRGCSPGIIPSLYLMQSVFTQVFNAVTFPILSAKITIEGLVNYIMSRAEAMKNYVITRWNMIKAIVGVWIATGINVATGAITFAKTKYNEAKKIIGQVISTSVSVGTSAIDKAKNIWNNFKDTVKAGVTGVVNVVFGGAGSPTEVDYLYAQGEYYEADYTPTTSESSPVITSSLTSIVTSDSSSSETRTVISEGAVKITIGSVDSPERVEEVANTVTIALSDLNDSKGR